ncbi:MAG: cytochrome P450 [Sphingobium sp.]
MTETITVEDFRLDDPEIQKNPYPFYPLLREERPVLKVDFFGQPNWVVTRRADITEVLMNPAIYSSATTPVPTVLFADPPEHARLRQIVAPRFTRGAIATLEPAITDQAQRLVDDIAAAGRCDMIEDFGARLTVTLIARLLGIADDHVLRLRTLTKRSGEYILALRTGKTPSPQAKQANSAIVDFMGDIFGQKNFSADGVMALLSAAQERGDLSLQESIQYAVLLFIAGHSTTTNLIGNAAFLLAQNPSCLDRIAAEPEFVLPFIEEVLRTRPSFHRIQRITSRETTLGGVTLPKGALIRVMLGAANRDPDFFTDPEDFDPDARRRAHVAFGQGIHTCLGNLLARLEAKIALTLLARRFSAIRLDPDRPAEPLAGGTMNEFGFEYLPVILTPRS